MITKKLFSEIEDALDDRSDWEKNQRSWYDLRYEGYPRPSLPYPNAPDMHYPLVDIEIEKLKPFYLQQIYAQERMATFIDARIGENASVEQSNTIISDDELKFDCELKQNSNFEQAAHVFIDKMLHYGLCIVKTMWKGGKLVFVPVNATHVIVPTHTASIQQAPWFVHVIRMSVSQYRANPKYEKSGDVIKKIKGCGDTRGSTSEEQDAKDYREGITGTEHDDSIILWEVYWKQTPDDKQWTISVVSPVAGITTRLCADAKLPYCIGSFSEKQELPFDVVTYEAATEGFYSPRGIAEILEPFELALCKNWNYQLQFLDFNGQPTFFVNSPMANLVNFTNEPGSTRPFGIERDAPLNAPLDLMQQMEMTRALAEDRVQMPDLGNTMHLTGKEGQKGEVTATQIRAIVGLSAQNNDLRSRLLKGQLAPIYRHAWDIICQYKQIEPKKALIVPSGTADSWNKENRTQKMLAMFQLLQGKPNVDQDELLKMLLEQDNPENVTRLFRDSQTASADEAEKQAVEFGTMTNGFTPQTRQDDDDFTHIQVLTQLVEARIQRGEPVTPDLAQRVLVHGAMHEEQMAAKKDPRAEQLNQQVAPVIAMLTQIAQHPTQPPEPLPPGTPSGVVHNPESNAIST
jgi:hypothetical protein